MTKAEYTTHDQTHAPPSFPPSIKPSFLIVLLLLLLLLFILLLISTSFIPSIYEAPLFNDVRSIRRWRWAITNEGLVSRGPVSWTPHLYQRRALFIARIITGKQNGKKRDNNHGWTTNYSDFINWETEESIIPKQRTDVWTVGEFSVVIPNSEMRGEFPVVIVVLLTSLFVQHYKRSNASILALIYIKKTIHTHSTSSQLQTYGRV